MDEYIERERVLGTINYLQEICNTEVENPDELKIFNDVYEEIYVEVGSIETDDVRPERHAEWLYVTEDGKDAFYECSRCGAYSNNCTNPFCWKCGAKMDGKDIGK